MNKIQSGRGRWVTIGLLMAGLLAGVVYGQAPAGQSPARPTPSAATAVQPASPNKVILKVGDVSVTRGELDAIVNSLTPQAQKQLSEQGRRALGDQYAMMILLSQDAVSRHLDSTPAFQLALARARREILAQAAYQEIVRQAAVTPEETSKYFAAHQSEFEEAMIRQVVVRKKPEGAKEGTPGLTAQEAKTRIEEIRKAMSSGEDPKKVAEQFQVPNVVRVAVEPSPLRRGSARPDMEKAAFELQDGQVSEVFDLPQALVFFQVFSHRQAQLKDVSSQIETTLRQQKVDRSMAELKKNATIWMDDDYFAAASKPGAQGTQAVDANRSSPGLVSAYESTGDNVVKIALYKKTGNESKLAAIAELKGRVTFNSQGIVGGVDGFRRLQLAESKDTWIPITKSELVDGRAVITTAEGKTYTIFNLGIGAFAGQIEFGTDTKNK